MTYLIIAIICSSAYTILFRFFKDHNIRITSAVAVNYLVCALVGWSLTEEALDISYLTTRSWAFLAIIQGIIFAINFYLLAGAVHKIGIMLATLASRLSVAIPVVAAFFLYDDKLTLLKLLGLFMSGLTLYFLSYTPKASKIKEAKKISVFALIGVFVGFGVHYTLLKVAEEFFLQPTEQHSYVMTAFGWAFVYSFIVEGVRALKDKKILRVADLLGGIFLGLANYTVVYMIVRTLSVQGMESSVVFPTFSVGVVVISSCVAFVVYKERLSLRQTLGALVGIASIVILNQ